MEMKGLNIVEIINNFVNSNFNDGNHVVQAKNYKNLLGFMLSNNIPFELELNEYEQLLENDKISNMISELLNLKNKNIYLDNPLFLSLALIYANNNGIKLDVSDNCFESNIYTVVDEYDDGLSHEPDSLSAYLKELVYDPFSPSEELEMFKRYSEGDNSVREDLIKHNLRLVVGIAKRYTSSGVEITDLIQEGNIGLSIAVDRFDYRTGNRFSTYATLWIKQAITRSIANYSKTIRIPVHLHDMSLRVKKFIKTYVISNGRKPSYEEISIGTALNLEKVKQIMGLSLPISLNAFVNAEGEGDTEFGEFVEDKTVEDPNTRIFFEQFRNIVFNTDILTEREKIIIVYRFGFSNGTILTLEEIGQKMGITRERVRQLEVKALEKLKNNYDVREFDEKNEFASQYSVLIRKKNSKRA